MAADQRQRQTAIDWASRGVEAIKTGAFARGRDLMLEAVRADRKNPFYRFDIALAHQGLGDIVEAVTELNAALVLKPDFDDASRRLGVLLGQYQLPDPGILDTFALRSALKAPNADHQALAEAAIARLIAAGHLGRVLKDAAARGEGTIAREMLHKRTDDLLRDDLFLAALSGGVIRQWPVEKLLTALRKTLLLDLPAERFEDKAMFAFALALARHGAASDYAWAESPAETAAIDAPGTGSQRPALLLQLLYRPLTDALGTANPAAAVASVRVKALRDYIAEVQSAAEAEALGAARFSAVPLAGRASEGQASVRGLYERAPYPRYASLTLPRPGSALPALRQVFAPAPLPMLETGFDVLVAGCGTGRHAIQAALGYGEKARVRAIDVSARSLAYAAGMARRFGVNGITFERADLTRLDPEVRTYDIIECVGVLHHLEDPFAGWKSLLGVLKPGGLMLVGLYSAVSRKDILELRKAKDYPGTECSDGEARAFRAGLLSRDSAIAASRDAYTLGEFRDLVLHPLERPLTIPEIAAFLKREGLSFRGFLLPGEVHRDFAGTNPGEAASRDLSLWEAYEAKNPRTFDGMYRFWSGR